jgi:hypothetical protein
MCTPAMTPGSSAPAGQLYVTDTGTQPESVTVGTFPAGGQGQALSRGQHQMPPAWVHVSYPRKWHVFPESSAGLQPGGSAYLPVSVTVPAGTPDGMYVVNLWAHTTSGQGGSGGITASAGAGAATLLYAGVGETPSCTIPAVTRQAGSPDQYVPAGAAPQQQPSKGLSSGGMEIIVVLAAIFALWAMLTRKK